MLCGMAVGEKDKIKSTSGNINISDAFEVFATNANETIIDFDLRKAIKEEQGALETDFDFVTTSELSAGIRTVNAEATGEINGTVKDAEVETKVQGESQVQFANTVTSTKVGGLDNTDSLNLLAEGEYELIFESYTEQDSELVFNAQLEVESTMGMDLGAIGITSALQLSANVTVTVTISS